MPSTTDNPTLSLIQQEINDCAQREKEYQLMRSLSENNNNVNGNNNHITNGNHAIENGKSTATPAPIKPPSTPNNKPVNGFRKIMPNPAVRGIMQQFIKSRGKLSQNKDDNAFRRETNWTMPDVIESTTRIVHTGEPIVRVRKNYVPVQERMKKEFTDLRNREMELKNIRKDSLSETNSLDDSYTIPESKQNLRKFKSMVQLNHDDEREVMSPTPSPTLKPARSLAELCDVNEDELNRPSALIKQWENLIKEKQERN